MADFPFCQALAKFVSVAKTQKKSHAKDAKFFEEQRVFEQDLQDFQDWFFQRKERKNTTQSKRSALSPAESNVVDGLRPVHQPEEGVCLASRAVTVK